MHGGHVHNRGAWIVIESDYGYILRHMPSHAAQFLEKGNGRRVDGYADAGRLFWCAEQLCNDAGIDVLFVLHVHMGQRWHDDNVIIAVAAFLGGVQKPFFAHDVRADER